MAIEYLDPPQNSKFTYLDDGDSAPSGAAKIASTIARPLLEMGGAVGGGILGGGADIPTGIIPGAIAGGALGYGVGKSAADLLDRGLGLKAPIQDAQQAITETGSNALKGGEMEAGNLVLNPIIKRAGNLAIKGASAYFGPEVKAIEQRLANPAMANASYPKTAQDLADHLNDLQGNLHDIEDKVWGSLLKLKAEPKSTLLGMLSNIKGQLKVTNTGQVASDADQAAFDAIDRLATRIKDMGTSNVLSPVKYGNGKNLEQFFDQKQLREIIQSVSKDINFQDPTASSKNASLLSFRHYLSEYLKTENPQYADLIQHSADRTALLENAENSFSLNKSRGQFVPSDTTIAKIKSLNNGTKLQSAGVADRVKNLTGLDLAQESQLANYASQFEKTATQGSRRAVMGKAIGGAIGALVGHDLGGAAIGSMAGGYLDKYAAQNLGATIDAINRLGLTGAIPAGPLGLAAGIASTTDNQ